MSENPFRSLTNDERQSLQAVQKDQSDKQLSLIAAWNLFAIETKDLHSSVRGHLKRLQKDILTSLMVWDGMVIPTADVALWSSRIQSILNVVTPPINTREPFVLFSYDSDRITVRGISRDDTPWVETLQNSVDIPAVLLPGRQLQFEDALRTAEAHNSMRSPAPHVQVVPVIPREDLHMAEQLSTTPSVNLLKRTPELREEPPAVPLLQRTVSSAKQKVSPTTPLPGLPQTGDLASMKQVADLEKDPVIEYYLKHADKRANAESESRKNSMRFTARIQAVCTILETAYPSQEWARLVAWLRERLNKGAVQDIVQVQKFLGIVSHAKYQIDGVFGWRTMRLLENLPNRMSKESLPSLIAQLGIEAPSAAA